MSAKSFIDDEEIGMAGPHEGRTGVERFREVDEFEAVTGFEQHPHAFGSDGLSVANRNLFLFCGQFGQFGHFTLPLALLRNTRKTDRDPLCPIASSCSVWHRGLAAFALLTDFARMPAAITLPKLKSLSTRVFELIVRKCRKALMLSSPTADVTIGRLGREALRPERNVAETLKINGNWKALFVGPNTKIRRELTPFLAPRFAAFAGHDLEIYPTVGQLVETFRIQQPNLCFLDVMSDRSAALAAIPDILRVKPEIPIIAVLSGNDPDLILRCLRQGTTEFLLQPFTDEQVQGSLEKLARQQPASMAGANRGKVLCFMPAKGGSGATTISCNLAYQWKRLEPQKRVLLADLDQLA